MSISQDFVNAFVESWNENMCDFKKYNNGKSVADPNIRVIDDIGREYTYWLPDVPLKCFYTLFNGSVCDEDHWIYFKKCFGWTNQKIGHVKDQDKSYDTFIECWNENIDKFMKQVYDRYNYERPIVVVDGDDLTWVELTTNTLQCFYIAFNGSVCDSNHWHYFMDCIDLASAKTDQFSESHHICRTDKISKITAYIKKKFLDAPK